MRLISITSDASNVEFVEAAAPEAEIQWSLLANDLGQTDPQQASPAPDLASATPWLQLAAALVGAASLPPNTELLGVLAEDLLAAFVVSLLRVWLEN